MKVTTIEEAQHIDNIKIDKFIGSFLNFEMAINEKFEDKNKGVDVKANVESDKDRVE